MDSIAIPTRSAVLNTALLQARLAAIKASKQSTKVEEDETNCCVICLERVTEKAQAQPCQHSTFDFICLASWVQERSCCPLCNTEVSVIHYAFADNEQHKTYSVASTSRTSAQSLPQTLASPRNSTRPSRPRRRNSISHIVVKRDDVVAERRRVYTANLFSMHVGSNRVSRYRDFTPHIFSTDNELQARARKWIRRELRIFEYLYPTHDAGALPAALPNDRRANNAEFLLEYIIAILKTVDIQGPTGQAIEMLREFIRREHAMLFLHELRGWLRSPYASLEEWDRNVQYADEVRMTMPARPLP